MPGMKTAFFNAGHEKIAFFFHARHEIFDGLPIFVPRLYLHDHGTGRWYQRQVMRYEIFRDMLF